MNVKSRAYRILRRMSAYLPIESPDQIESGLPDLRDGEEWIGRYRNYGSEHPGDIVFSTERFFVKKADSCVWLDYEKITDIDIAEEKRRVTKLVVTSGEHRLDVPVLGGNDQVRDAFAVWRFLSRSREDRTKALAAEQPSER